MFKKIYKLVGRERGGHPSIQLYLKALASAVSPAIATPRCSSISIIFFWCEDNSEGALWKKPTDHIE